MSFHTVVDFALNFAPLFESCSKYCDLLTFLYCFICSSSSGKKNSVGSVSDAEESPKHKPSNNRASSALSGQIDPIMPVSPIKSSKSSDTIDGNANPAIEIVNDLKKQLVMKDNLLTETRLEALSSAHQLESLRDTVTKMRTELMSVRSQNEKLQCIVVCRNSSSGQKSLNSSQNSLNNNKNDLENGTDDGACGSGSGRCVICLLKFMYSEKATKI